MIRVVGISKKLKNGKVLLENISFEVKKGEFVGILGPSGAGKTLTLKSLIGLTDLNDGQVWIGDEAMEKNIYRTNSKTLKNIRSKIALIFQGFHLVQRSSVLENVLMGRLGSITTWRSIFFGFTKIEKLEALEALQKVKMHAFAETKVYALSGGEKQRVAIARAIFQQPQILLADEPISSLDPKNARSIMLLLKELSLDFPVIGVFHQPDLCEKYCSRIIAIKEGNVFYDGNASLSESLLESIYGEELSTLMETTNL